MSNSLRDEVEAIETRIRRLGFTVIANHLRQALDRHPPADGVSVPAAVIAFLKGAGPLEGVWFGDKPETERGQFWWRKHLPNVAQSSDTKDKS